MKVLERNKTMTTKTLNLEEVLQRLREIETSLTKELTVDKRLSYESHYRCILRSLENVSPSDYRTHVAKYDNYFLRSIGIKPFNTTNKPMVTHERTIYESD